MVVGVLRSNVQNDIISDVLLSDYDKPPSTHANINDVFVFGKYKQNNNYADMEAIEWEILDRADDKMLFVSKYCLDCLPYNITNLDVK